MKAMSKIILTNMFITIQQFLMIVWPFGQLPAKEKNAYGDSYQNALNKITNLAILK